MNNRQENEAPMPEGSRNLQYFWTMKNNADKKILIHGASHEKNVWRQRMNKADYERNENEDIRSYLTRAARIYAFTVDNRLPKEENVFQVECSETELQEFKNHVFEIILPIVRKVVECESKSFNSRGAEAIMRIAVTYENGQIFQHFGHTETFKIYDVEEGKVVHSEVVDTNGSGHGALAGVLNALNADV